MEIEVEAFILPKVSADLATVLVSTVTKRKQLPEWKLEIQTINVELRLRWTY